MFCKINIFLLYYFLNTLQKNVIKNKPTLIKPITSVSLNFISMQSIVIICINILLD